MRKTRKSVIRNARDQIASLTVESKNNIVVIIYFYKKNWGFSFILYIVCCSTLIIEYV